MLESMREVEHGQSVLDDLAEQCTITPPDDEWPDPEEIVDDLAEVEEFKPEMLPESLRPWVIDIADRLQCPVDFVAIPAIVALGSLIGRKVGIRPQAKTNWTVVPNVWGCIVGRPGSMKSPAVSESMAPLRKLAAQARERYEAEVAAWETDSELAKLTNTAAKQKAVQEIKKGKCVDPGTLRNESPEKPTLRRYTANDGSLEAVGELLRQNPNGLMIERDEIASLLSSLGQEENAAARGFYLTAADGRDGYTFDRIGRGLDLHIPAVCLSLLGTTQPGKLGAFLGDALKQGASDDGLMQRFGLLVWPAQRSAWTDVDRWPDSEARRAAHAVFERCDSLTADTVGADDDNGERFLRFSPEALEMFIEWRTELESTLLSGDLHPAIESHFAKYRKTIPALALIFHLAEGNTGQVDGTSTARALLWFDYLTSHAKRCYGASRITDNTAAKRIIDQIRKGDLKDGFKARRLKRLKWSGLTESTTVDRALDLLVDLNWLAEQKVSPGQQGGRGTVVYSINPKAANHGLS